MEEEIIINNHLIKKIGQIQDLLIELEHSDKRVNSIGHLNNAMTSLKTDNKIRENEQSKIRN